MNTHSALFVQLNDVCHIDFPVTPDAPTELVLPRVTALVRRLRTLVSPAAPEPNVHFCVSGDFLAPSALTRPTKGQHMSEVLNAMGVNFVTPGNHDFEPDLSAEDFYACVERSGVPRIL